MKFVRQIQESVTIHYGEHTTMVLLAAQAMDAGLQKMKPLLLFG
jgi:hypothetical protein